jgi:hypothetical protein
VTTNKEVIKTKFFQTACYFRDLINTVDTSHCPEQEDFLDKFINFILTKTQIIRINCENENFAIKLFTILNDRGLDLSVSDIVKANLMLEISSDENRESFNEVWKRLENSSRDYGEKLENIFTYYLYYLTGKNQTKSLQQELKEQFKGKDSNKLILDIEHFSINLYDIVASKKANLDKDINTLKYLRQSIYWKTILVTAKHIGYSDYDRLKNILVGYYYQNWISGLTVSKVKQTSFNVIIAVRDKKPFSEIKKILSDNLKGNEINIINYLASDNVYKEGWLKPVLIALEYKYTEKREFIPLESTLHVEHILPKEWNKPDLHWNSIITNKEIADRKLNSLGNLTLLSGNQNIRASNDDYINKMKIFEGNDGKGHDGTTAFVMTRKLMNDYKVWNLSNLDIRAEVLKKEILKLFQI